MEETPNEQYKRLSKTTKRAKYGNTRREQDGVKYDSLAELKYKGILDLQVKAQIITGYDYHVKIPLMAEGGKLVGYYEVDYLVYYPDGSQQYHDVKSAAVADTRSFQWKARHVKAQYGADIVLIDSKTFKPLVKK